MLWLLIASIVAASEATKDIFHSQDSVKKLSPLLKAWALATLSLPVIFIVLAVKGIPEVDPKFWFVVIIHAILLAFASVLYMRALALGPLSQTQPILALTTCFLVLTNPIMTNDKVTMFGWAGIGVIALGIYATTHPGEDPLTKKPQGFWSPFREMVRQPGVASKLAVAGIYSLTANLDKLGLQMSSGPFYLAVDLVLVSVFLGAILIVMRMRGMPLIIQQRDERQGVLPVRYLLIGGSINAFTVLMQMWALSFAPVPFVIAVKRVSIILTSLWGYLVRKERAPHWYRIAGMLMVVAGIALILFLGSERSSAPVE